MPTINLGNRSIPGGASVTNLTFVINSKATVPRIEDGDHVVINNPFPKKGLPPAPVKAIEWTATFAVHGTTPMHKFGFKQVAFMRGSTRQFSGLKSIDGSIVEGTSGLNFTPLLDVTVLFDKPTGALTAPWAPFYTLGNPAIIKPGVEVPLDAHDSPGGSFPLEERNHITDRKNFLDSVQEATDFVTCLVVQMPDSSHVAVAGFRWTYQAEAKVRWNAGTPTVSGNIRQEFRVSVKSRDDLNGGEVGILENPGLRFADSAVFRFNTGVRAAERLLAASPIGPGALAKIDAGDFAMEQFDHFQPGFTSPKTAL